MYVIVRLLAVRVLSEYYYFFYTLWIDMSSVYFILVLLSSLLYTAALCSFCASQVSNQSYAAVGGGIMVMVMQCHPFGNTIVSELDDELVFLEMVAMCCSLGSILIGTGPVAEWYVVSWLCRKLFACLCRKSLHL